VKYRDLIAILEEHGFTLLRQKGSHRQYEGTHSGRRWLVTVAVHGMNDDILPQTFASMRRQSGLPKAAFRR
jgi:predicted RNA binding protein YcfA (HicA-like mRNA interferase family)